MVIELPAWAVFTMGAVFSFAFLWVWDKTFRATLGPALRTVGNVGFGGIAGHGSVHPLRFLVRTADSIEAWTARGLQGSERAVVYGMTQLGGIFALLFGVPLAIALALYELANYVIHHAPHAITRVVHETIVKPVERVVHVTAAVSKAQFNKLTARVQTLEHRITHAVTATAGAVASPFPRIGRIEKTAKAQAKRITRLEKLLAAGVGVAVVARALSRLELGWLRCRNVNKTGKAVCGMNPSLLNSLLLDVATLSVAFNIEEFARELQTVTGEAARLIHNFAD